MRADSVGGPTKDLQRTSEIVFPNVSAVHDSKRKVHCRWKGIQNPVQFMRCADGVEVERIDRQATGGFEILTQVAKKGGEQQLQRWYRLADLFIQLSEGGSLVAAQIDAKDWLIDLNP